MQDRNDASSARSPAEHNEAHNHKACGSNQYPFLLKRAKRYNAQPYPSSGTHQHVHRQRSRRPRVAPRVTWSVALRVDRRIVRAARLCAAHVALDLVLCMSSACVHRCRQWTSSSTWSRTSCPHIRLRAAWPARHPTCMGFWASACRMTRPTQPRHNDVQLRPACADLWQGVCAGSAGKVGPSGRASVPRDGCTLSQLRTR